MVKAEKGTAKTSAKQKAEKDAPTKAPEFNVLAKNAAKQTDDCASSEAILAEVGQLVGNPSTIKAIDAIASQTDPVREGQEQCGK